MTKESTLIERIIKESNGAFSRLRLKKMRFIRARRRCELILELPKAEAAVKDEITALALTLLPEGVEYSVVFDEVALSAGALIRVSEAFLRGKFHAFCGAVEAVAGDEPSVSISVTESAAEIIEERGLCGELAAVLTKEFFCAPKIVLNRTGAVPPERKRPPVLDLPERVIKPVRLERFIGEIILEPARYIADAKAENPSVVLSGTVGAVKRFEPAGVMANGRAKSAYYRFSLTDFSGSIDAIIFENDGNKERLSKLSRGETIVALGAVNESERGSGFKIRSISYCEIPAAPPPAPPRSEPEEYYTVFPEPIKISKQEGMLNVETADEYLKNNVFVVFDLETTGTGSSDEIVEIGAVKIVNGEFTEQFSTLVRASVPINPGASAVSGITDGMLKEAPTFSEIISDFYKFTYGTVLVGQNVLKFDLRFVARQGGLCGYKFDNAVVDTMTLAPEKLGKLPRVSLEYLTKKLGIVNDNAHRAMSDTIATAKLFLALLATPAS